MQKFALAPSKSSIAEPEHLEQNVRRPTGTLLGSTWSNSCGESCCQFPGTSIGEWIRFEQQDPKGRVIDTFGSALATKIPVTQEPLHDWGKVTVPVQCTRRKLHETAVAVPDFGTLGGGRRLFQVDQCLSNVVLECF